MTTYLVRLRFPVNVLPGRITKLSFANMPGPTPQHALIAAGTRLGRALVNMVPSTHALSAAIALAVDLEVVEEHEAPCPQLSSDVEDQGGPRGGPGSQEGPDLL